MGISDELEQLDELRRSGALSEAEFQQAKAAVLARYTPPADESTAKLQEQLDELARDNEIARIDREWEKERLKHAIGPFRAIPTKAGSLARGGAVALLGVFLLVQATRHSGGFLVLCGLIMIAVGVCAAAYQYLKAADYEAAEQAYRSRRARATGERSAVRTFLDEIEHSP